MRWIIKMRHLGTGWLLAGVGVAVGVGLAVPAATGPGGTLHTVMAGADGGVSGSTAGGAAAATTLPGSPAAGPTNGAPASGHHVSVTPEPSTTARPPDTAASTTPRPSTTIPPETTPTTTASPVGTASPAAGATTTECAGAVTDLTLTPVDGGRGVVVTVMVSGQVGWMSALADGVGGAALGPIPGGWRGTITAAAPIPAGTVVRVGSCHNHVHASAVVGGPPGAGPGAADTTTTVVPLAATTTTPPDEACGPATITSLRAALAGGGRAVRIIVAVTGQLSSMSGEVEGFGAIALTPVAGGFRGALLLSGGATIPAGTTVVVGACGGAVRATTAVAAD